jgi:23S rRNA (adenine2030-N6)-methyltransferase
MNYRHIFHAGNRCDVVKHAALTLALRHLRKKNKGFAVLDSHAGTGFYDLGNPRAQKTGEASNGIENLLSSDAVPELIEYYEVLRKLNPLWNGKGFGNFRIYPGSPLFIFHALREQDRLIACELHPDDARALRLQAPADKRFQIHCRDGYEALGAFLPPPEKRGLVLIDPPYERADEFDVVVKRLAETHRRWPAGIYMIWYPVKDRPALWKFHEALAATGIPKILRAEFIYEEDVRADRLSGSGLIVINPPWQLNEELRALFPALHKAMKTTYAETIVTWIAE